MPPRVRHVLVLIACLLATGSHWDLVQVFAWGQMFAHNVRVLPMRDAVELTFSPAGQCDVCLIVSKGRQDGTGDAAAALQTLAKDPLIFLRPTSIVIAAPLASAWIEPEMTPPAHDRRAPPTPPPRGLG